mmetsp:Transcript_24718/g.46171  ORF Transcript_24718/g.46171 Transcript_24718/m.46171 type:complete len:193 (-) Transcript_24718:289-867(-)
MGEWSCPLNVRGVTRMLEMLFSLLSFSFAAGGWTCDKSTPQNELVIAVGAIYFLFAAVFLYFEGRDEMFPNAYVPVCIDLVFFVLTFAASVSSILDSEALNCGYEMVKAAAVCTFMNMLCIGVSLIISISDLFDDDAPPPRPAQKLDDIPSDQRLAAHADLPKGWSVHKTDDGYEYYFHADTGKSQWHKPTK